MKAPAEIQIEQAIYTRIGEDPPRLQAHSPGFVGPLPAEVEKLLIDFGVRPEGFRGGTAVFAYPLSASRAAVVRVADLGDDDAAASPVGFQVFVVSRDAYRRYVVEPFRLAERFQTMWQATGMLPTLAFPAEPPPPRTVEQVQQVLRRVKGPPLAEDVPAEEQELYLEQHSESPALLGGVQVLVDGGKLVFERPQPDTELLKALWTLLPNRTRAELWPASFAFSGRLPFDVKVVPRITVEDIPGYTTEEQAADYPDGRYEFNLQVAAESGNQRDLDALFERRTWNDTWKLAVSLLVLVTVLTVASRILLQRPAEIAMPSFPKDRRTQVDAAAGTLAAQAPLGTALYLYAAAPPSPRQHECAIAAGLVGAGTPWNALTVAPPARKTWNDLRPIRTARERWPADQTVKAE